MRRDYDTRSLTTEVDQAITRATWRRDWKIDEAHNDEGVTAKAYVGEAGGWRLIVVGFAFPDRDGFGADGTALNQRGLALRLSKEQAAEAYRVAEEKTKDVDQG